MNAFYQRKAAVPREARSGELRERLAAWRDKRLLTVAAACEKTPDSFRQKFGFLHTGFAQTVDKILTESDENLVAEVENWINNLEKSFNHNTKGANHDAIGLCGAELKFILKNYLESL
jgi:hypothetical protein